MLNIEIENYQQAAQILEQLPAKMQRKVIIPSLRASAKSMLKATKAAVPKSSGVLAKQLKIVTLKKGRTINSSDIVIRPVFKAHKSGNINQFYGHMINWGTKERTPRKGLLLKFKDPRGGGFIFTRKAAPIKPTPFLLQGFTATQNQVFSQFGGELAKSTEKFINTKFK